jgi:hypothetical protein
MKEPSPSPNQAIRSQSASTQNKKKMQTINTKQLPVYVRKQQVTQEKEKN